MTIRRNGFSLIELIIAMALVAIVSAFAVPEFRRYVDNSNLKTATREVTGDIFTARQMAVGENVNGYTLVFDVGGNSYSLARSDTGVTLWTKSLASFGSGVRLESVAFDGTVINFQKRGTVEQGHLVLVNDRGSKSTVTVSITGRTHVASTIQ